jgi:anaerobic magnesium-protoporphyrin IX monomethyl ester cyclase
MKVTLIFTTNELNPNFSELSFKDENVGFIPPLGLMTVASIFEKHGVEVQLLDMDAERLTYYDALERIKKFSPDMIGFTLSTYSFHPLLRWIKKFKQDTGLPVIVGGMHAGLYAEEIMTYREIDYLIIGEAEIPLPEFIKAFRNGKRIDGLPSLGYRDNGRIIIDKTSSAVTELDQLPFPSRHLIKNDLYYNILARKKNFTAMLSARGCPYRCTFCNQNKPKYRARSAQNFVTEVKENYEKYGIREFDIYDTTFTADKKRVLEICRRIDELGYDLSWTVRSRVDTVNEEVLRALSRSGCHTMMYGIESSDPGILKAMRKGFTPDRVKTAVSMTNDAGIETLGFFMFGYPGESSQTIEETVKLSLELPLEYAQYTVLVPYPDTELYDYYRKNGLAEDYWREYTLDYRKERKLDLVGTKVTREEAGSYVAAAYKKFYFRPRIIWHRAKRMNSFSEFKRLTKGAIGIIQNWIRYQK